MPPRKRTNGHPDGTVLAVPDWHTSQPARPLDDTLYDILYIVEKGGRISTHELDYQARKADLDHTLLPDQIGTLLAAGLVEHTVEIIHRYELTPAGRAANNSKPAPALAVVPDPPAPRPRKTTMDSDRTNPSEHRAARVLKVIR